MDDSFLLIFDLIALLCGVFCLYTWFRLRREKRLFKNSIICPSSKEPKDCLDEEAYIAYIQPKLLILGIVTFLFGAICMVDEKVHMFNLLGQELCTAVSLAVVVWFGVCTYKANKRYW